MYNPCQTSRSDSMLAEIQRVLQETRDNVENILLGDFNLHHPLWKGTGVEADEDAKTLIMLTEEAYLKQVLPPGTVTWQRHESKSTLDLVFLSSLLCNSLLECQKTLSSDTHSDIEPIRTAISVSTIEAEKRQTRNWNKTNTLLLGQTLDCNPQNSSTLYPPVSKT